MFGVKCSISSTKNVMEWASKTLYKYEVVVKQPQNRYSQVAVSKADNRWWAVR